MFDNTDFDFSYNWKDNGNILYVNHFWVSDENRGFGRSSAILETLVRVAYYEGAEVVQVSIGGGEKLKNFLIEMDFTLFVKENTSLK